MGHCSKEITSSSNSMKKRILSRLTDICKFSFLGPEKSLLLLNQGWMQNKALDLKQLTHSGTTNLYKRKIIFFLYRRIEKRYKDVHTHQETSSFPSFEVQLFPKPYLT